MKKGNYWETEAKQGRKDILDLKLKVDSFEKQLTRKTHLHNKTADRLATERMKRRHFKGQTLILQDKVEALEKNLVDAKKHIEILEEQIDKIASVNFDLGVSNEELKRDVIHLVRQQRKES